jgi:hypothetical protein
VAEAAFAQPIAPPRRPTFSTYNNIYAQASSGFGYGPYGGLFFGNSGGLAGNGFAQQWGAFGANQAFQQQNQLLSQQLTSFNQNLSNFQQFMATGVNPNFPATGHAASFNNLGHWYASAGGQSAGGSLGGVTGGAFTTGRTAGIGIPMTPGGGNAAGPRTAGIGYPVGSMQRK